MSSPSSARSQAFNQSEPTIVSLCTVGWTLWFRPCVFDHSLSTLAVYQPLHIQLTQRIVCSRRYPRAAPNPSLPASAQIAAPWPPPRGRRVLRAAAAHIAIPGIPVRAHRAAVARVAEAGSGWGGHPGTGGNGSLVLSEPVFKYPSLLIDRV